MGLVVDVLRSRRRFSSFFRFRVHNGTGSGQAALCAPISLADLPTVECRRASPVWGCFSILTSGLPPGETRAGQFSHRPHEVCLPDNHTGSVAMRAALMCTSEIGPDCR